MDILRLEVYTLSESHTYVLSMVIPLFTQTLPTPLLLIFSFFFAEEDEAQAILGLREDKSMSRRVVAWISLCGT